MAGITLCTPQPTYVIVEQIHPKAGLPAFGNTIGPGLYQVFRRVLQVCDEQDMFFDGRRITGMPLTWQYIQELLRPGNQITTRPTGQRQFVLVYVGYKNLLTPLPKLGSALPSAWTQEYDLGMPPTPFRYGSDPIPRIELHGNPRAQFVMPGGKPPAVAVGVFMQRSGLLELPSVAQLNRVLTRLLQSKPAR